MMNQDQLVHTDPETERVVLGTAPAGATAPAGLPLAGGVWLVNPLDPGSAALAITDLPAARDAVVALYGLAAWDALPDAVSVPMRGWAAPDATRLALLRWLFQFSPDELDLELIELEAAVLEARLESIRDTEPGRVSEPAQRRALEVAADIASGQRPGLPGLVELVTEYLEHRAGGGDPESVAALAGVARAAGARDERAGRWMWSQPDQLTPVGSGIILDEESPGAAAAWRTCGVDWELTPPRVFAAGEDAIAWRSSGRQVEVSVAAGSRPEGSWVARLHSPDFPIPLAIIPLSCDGRIWSGAGTALLPPTGNRDEIWVDITDAADPRPARVGAQRAAATARRWASRGACLARYHVNAAGLVHSNTPGLQAIGCLERARSAYTEAEILADSDESHAAAANLEVGRTLHALLAAAEGYEADDVAPELDQEAAALGLDRWAEVDLGAAGWQLTLAEWALIVPE